MNWKLFSIFFQEFAKEYQVLCVEKQQSTTEAGIKILLYDIRHSLQLLTINFVLMKAIL